MAESGEKGFRETAGIIGRSKWLIVATCVFGVSAGLALTVMTAPVYQAEATVMVLAERSPSDLMALSVGALGEHSTAVFNQVEILESRTLAQEVARELIASPETGEFGILADEDGVRTQRNVAKALRRSITVQPSSEADIITLSVRAGAGREATVIANTYIDEYVAYNQSAARGEMREVKAFLSEQLEIVDARLYAAEETLRQYQEEHRMVGLPVEAEAVVEQITEFEGLLNETRAELGMSEARLEYLRSELREQMDTLPQDIAEVSSPMIMNLRETLAELEGGRSQLLAGGYAESHPKMVQVRDEIEETKRRLIETTRAAVDGKLSAQDPLAYSQGLIEKILVLEVDVESLSARAAELEDVVESYSERLTELPEASLELVRLDREKKVSENIYMMLLESYEDARLGEAREMGGARVIDRAEEPEEPISPNRKVNVAVGGLLGLALGLGLAFVKAGMDDTVVSATEIEDAAGLAVLGIIPQFGRTGRRGRKRAAGVQLSLERHLVTHQHSNSRVCEAYRTLRTNLSYLGQDGPPKTLVVTSPGPSEGKSTTSVNLAITMARQGTSVVLVDGDLRRSVLHDVLSISLEPGLSGLLRGTASVDDVIRPTSIENLSLITGGVSPENPAELVGSYEMESVIRELSERFECVLFDMPPVLLLTDAAVVAAKTEATLLVVRCGETRRMAMVRASGLLRNVRANIVGTVLNMTGRRADAYDGYARYYKEYEQYYKTRSNGDESPPP